MDDDGSRRRAPGRRGVLRVAGGLAVGAVASGLVVAQSGGGTVSVAEAASTGAAGSGAASKTFTHPGLLHTEADFARMRAKVRAKAQPWHAGWEVLAANSHSSSAWKPDPLVTVVRGGTGENYGTLYNDIAAAYQNALRWKITGDRANGNAARDILNAWSATLKTVTGDADRFIAAGIYGYEFANAAEIMRGYPGFHLGRFQTMMLNVFYPLNNQFLTRHNGAYITNYWGSWDMLTMASILAIGILCDQPAKVSQAIGYFRHGAGNGSVLHEMPHLYPGGLAQWIEVGRDQGHATLGVGLMGAICQMAWNQGYDLYAYDDSRFLKGAEYVAKYNLGHSVPYTPYTWVYGAPGIWSGSQTFTAASPDGRGDIRPIWEILYNHYVRRRGLHAPYIAAYVAKVRPEGGGGNYGPDSGGYDQLGFGTLTYTL
jgi:Alginate lyase